MVPTVGLSSLIPGRVKLFDTVKRSGPLVNVVPDDTVTLPSIIISPDCDPIFELISVSCFQSLALLYKNP